MILSILSYFKTMKARRHAVSAYLSALDFYADAKRRNDDRDVGQALRMIKAAQTLRLKVGA